MPDEVILSFEGKKYIFITTNKPKQDSKFSEHHFEMIPIQTGVNEHSHTEVALPPHVDKSAQVVIKGAYDLLTKMKNSEEAHH